MTWRSKYLLVCDERGTSRWPSRTKTWAYGGYIIAASHIQALSKAWENVKQDLCDDPSMELKWAHFFLGKHQTRSQNPLKSKDSKEWEKQASWAINYIFKECNLFPVNTIVRKDHASDVSFINNERTKDKGYRIPSHRTL